MGAAWRPLVGIHNALLGQPFHSTWTREGVEDGAGPGRERAENQAAAPPQTPTMVPGLVQATLSSQDRRAQDTGPCPGLRGVGRFTRLVLSSHFITHPQAAGPGSVPAQCQPALS